MRAAPVLTVRSLHLYPVKSCRGVPVDRAQVASGGLVGDRAWQILVDGQPATQRRHPMMATIEATVRADGGLRLAAPRHGAIDVASPTGDLITVPNQLGLMVDVQTAGAEAAAWLSDVLQEPDCRLVSVPSQDGLEAPDPLDALFSALGAFADAAPLLVVGEASHRWLVERAEEPFGIDRFRANIVVGTETPFDEETWDHFRIGSVELRHGVAWPRCAVPQVDQLSGQRGREPARVLARYRFVRQAPEVPAALRSLIEGQTVFGIGCSLADDRLDRAEARSNEADDRSSEAVIRVGDSVQVAARRAPLLASPVRP